MEKSNVKIVIIDDDVKLENYPLVIKLKEKYSSVEFFNKSSTGLEYVLNNLSSKIIVLLDINLGSDEPDGHRILDEIRRKSKLVCVIIFTAISESQHLQFGDFINNHAYAFLSKTTDYQVVLDVVKDAENHLNSQVDTAIEEWISLLPDEERKKPFLVSKEGKEYTLNDLLLEIRNQTEFGRKTEKDLLMLTIDLLYRGKKKLND